MASTAVHSKGVVLLLLIHCLLLVQLFVGGFVFDNVHNVFVYFKTMNWFTRLLVAFALLFFKHAFPAI